MEEPQTDHKTEGLEPDHLQAHSSTHIAPLSPPLVEPPPVEPPPNVPPTEQPPSQSSQILSSDEEGEAEGSDPIEDSVTHPPVPNLQHFQQQTPFPIPQGQIQPISPHLPHVHVHLHQGPAGLCSHCGSSIPQSPIFEDGKRKKRPRKDPNAPKRNMSAYMFFANTHRPTVMKHYPDITCPDVTRILGKMWSEATDEEKKMFDILAEKDKQRYQNEKKIYATLPKKDEYPKKPRKKRAKKDPSAPKRNMSAYLFFSNIRRHDVKKERPELSFSEIAKVLSKMWKEMEPEDKKPFDDMARNDKIRYFKEKKEFDDMKAKQEAQVAQQRESIMLPLSHPQVPHMQSGIPLIINGLSTSSMIPIDASNLTQEQLEHLRQSGAIHGNTISMPGMQSLPMALQQSINIHMDQDHQHMQSQDKQDDLLVETQESQGTLQDQDSQQLQVPQIQEGQITQDEESLQMSQEQSQLQGQAITINEGDQSHTGKTDTNEQEGS